jgi:hypothetical protein
MKMMADKLVELGRSCLIPLQRSYHTVMLTEESQRESHHQTSLHALQAEGYVGTSHRQSLQLIGLSW